MAPQTIDSDAPPFVPAGRARDTSHVNPVCIEIRVTVQGSRHGPSGAASASGSQPFVEETRTVLAFEQGAVLRMSETTVAGQILILKNLRLNREAACRVVNYKPRESVKGYVEVEFLEPEPGFWGIEFPAPPATRTAQAAEQLRTAAPRISAPTAVLQSQPVAAKSQNAGVPLLPDLLPTETQVGGVSAREPSPSSLFGFEPPQAQPASPKPPAAAPVPPPIEKAAARPASQQSPPPEDPTSLTDLLDSLTPLGEQVLLGKSPASSAPNLRKTPVPGAFPPYSGPLPPDMPAERKSQDFSLQVSAESIHSEPAAQISPRVSPDFEHPPLSGEPVFSSAPRKSRSAVLGGPIFSAGESTQTSSTSGASTSCLIVGAIAVVIVAAAGFGYYRWHSRSLAPAAMVVVAPAPSPSSHDVTAAVDATNTTASQSAPVAGESAPAPSVARTPVPATAPPSAPAHDSTTRTPVPAANTQARAASAPPPPQAVPQPAPRNQTPANMRMSSPSPNSPSRAAMADAPNLSADMPGGVSSTQANSLGGIVQTNSAAVAPPRPSTDFHSPELISSVAPVYPDMARKEGIQGDVVVDLLVDETGKVAEAHAVSGPPILREAAVEALRKRKYRPATLDGRTTTAHVMVTIHFKTQQ